MSTQPIPLVARAERPHAPSAVLKRAAESIATRRQQTVVDVLHGRAVQHYAGAVRQYVTLRLRSEHAGRRVMTRVRALVAAARSEELLAPPGIRAQLYRLARRAADELAAEGFEHPTVERMPFRPGDPEQAHTLGALRALPREDAELLELHYARELQPLEIAAVLALPLQEVELRLASATQLARARVAGASLRHTGLETLLLHAFALELPDEPTGADGIAAPTVDAAALGGPPRSMTGRVIAGRYAIEARVGSGAFGDVYRARDTEVRGHVVALKLLHQPSPSEEERERALRELRLIASVFHPSVVQFKDHGWHEGRLWFVMPWYEGETLEDRIERDPLTRQEARAIFEPLARALASMHARGIRHQDIKPENIFLANLPGDTDPLPVLLDLGVAAEDAEMIFAGTPNYFAPEVACQFASVPDKPPVGHAADVFALALALRNALEPSTQEDIPANAVETFIEARARHVPELPRNPQLHFLDASLRRWMAFDPDERPTAAELAEELSILTLPERRRARRRRALAVALPLTLMVTLAAGLTYQHVQQRELSRAMAVQQAERTAESLRGSLVETEAHVEQLRGRVQEGAFTRQELQASLAANSHRLTTSEARVAALSGTVDELSNQAAALTSALGERRERVANLERELQAAQAQVGTLGQRLDERRQELQTQQVAHEDTRRSLRDSRAAEAEARARADTNADLVAAERVRAEALAASVARLQREQVRLASERDEAEQARRTAEEELRALRRATRPTSRDEAAQEPVPEPPPSPAPSQVRDPGVIPQQAPPPAA
ncbi:MAG: protein kinase [Myxococcales bacterium]|nr:protein kinase [Myxococcales bacterium]